MSFFNFFKKSKHKKAKFQNDSWEKQCSKVFPLDFGEGVLIHMRIKVKGKYVYREVRVPIKYLTKKNKEYMCYIIVQKAWDDLKTQCKRC
jgi:hypothetical protein